MALVSYVPTAQAAESIRRRFENMETKGHDVPNFLRTLAHSPDIMEAFIGLNGALNRTQLDPKLRELAYVKASEINACGYCMQHHKAGARKAGLNDAQINETESYETNRAYDELQKDVLRYTDEVTRNVTVSDEVIERLKQRLSERELVELAVTVALANFTNRISETLRLELP
jgi:uncharacterized peroxidase-related enzyme